MDRSKSFLALSARALYVHFALQLVAGGLLATVYRADPEGAHASVVALHRWPWTFVQAFHYWGSAIMIVHAGLHLVAVTWAGWWRGPQVRGYFAALALAGLSLAFQLTGNALPWDRHGVQTAAVEVSIAARVPKVGPSVSHLMAGGDEVGAATLELWWKAHAIVLPIALALAIALGFGAVKVKTARWPLALPALGALALAIVVAAPLGTAATPDDYGRFDAKPSWYTVPMHGLLVWGDRLVPGGGWIGAALLPGLLAAALLALPALRKAKPAVGGGLVAGIALLLAAATATSGGEFAPLVGTRDPRVRVAATPQKTEAKDALLASKGRALFRTQNCNGCHGEDGLKGGGGPSLANLWKEHPEAEYTMRYVKSPQSVQKGSTMPAYANLKEPELRALAEFLRFPR